MKTPITSRPLLRLALGLVSVLGATAALPAYSKTDNIFFPNSGIICDRSTRICYDRTGYSLPKTRSEFGSSAANNLLRRANRGANLREFQISTGEVCDLQTQRCWDDGWSRRNISNRLSRQLFGNNVGRNNNLNNGWNNNYGNSGWNNNYGNSGWNNNLGNSGWNNNYGNSGWNNNYNNNAWNGQNNNNTNFCQLSQRGQVIFNGPCDLLRQQSASGPGYLVDFRNGRRYSFYNRQNQLVMADTSGIWPVAYNNTANGALLRWGDMQLLARQSGAVYQPQIGNPTGQVLQNLINGLFR